MLSKDGSSQPYDGSTCLDIFPSSMNKNGRKSGAPLSQLVDNAGKPLLAAASLQVSAAMIEDRVYTVTSPVAQLTRNSFVVIENPANQSELVAVSGDEKSVVHYFPSEGSNSGWGVQRFPIESTAPIMGLEAAYQGEDLYIFLLANAANKPYEISYTLTIYRLPNGQAAGRENITNPNIINDCWSLALLKTANEQLYYYITYANGFNLYQLTSSGLTQVFGGWETGANFNYQLVPSASDPSQIEVMRIGQYSGMITQRATLTKSGNTWHASAWNLCVPAQDSNSGAGLMAIPGDKNPSDFLAVKPMDETFDFQLVYYHGCVCDDGFTWHTLTNPNSLAAVRTPNSIYWIPEGKTASIGVDEAGKVVIFAVDPTNVLWVLRQTGVDSNGSLVFGQWDILGDRVNEFRCPAVMSDGPELFYINGKQEIVHKKQDLVTTGWSTDILDSPSPSGQPSIPVTAYNTQIRTLTANNTPADNRPLTITTSRKSIVIANGLAYHIDEYNPALLQSNVLGTLSLKVVVDSLAAPEIRVFCADFMKVGTTKNFAADIKSLQRLSGQDTSFPVDSAALVKAGVLPSHIDPTVATNFADALKNAGGIMANMRANTTLGHKRTFTEMGVSEGGWAFRFNAPSDMQVVCLTPEEAKPYLADTPFILGQPAIFEDTWLGDLLSYAQQFVHKVSEIVISVVDEVIHIAITIAGKVYKFVTQFIYDIANTLRTIFDRIEAFYETLVDVFTKVVQWLRQLFDWDDILNTKKVLGYLLTQTFDNMKTAVQTMEPEVANFFEKGKKEVAGFFNQMEQQLGQESISGWGQRHSIDVDKNPHQAVQDENSMQMNYVLDHMMNATTNNPALLSSALVPTAGTSIDFTPFMNSISQAESDPHLQAAQSKMDDFFSQISSPTQLLDAVAVTFLDVVKQAIVGGIDAIEKVTIAFLNLIIDVINSFEQILEASISIPVISDIYKELTGSELTLLDAFTLMAAMPVTILYKLIHNNQAPFSSQTVTHILSQPIYWPSLGSQTNRQFNNESELVTDAVWDVFGGISTILSFLRAPISAGKVALKLSNDPGAAPIERVLSYLDATLSLLSKVSGGKLFVTDGISGADEVVTVTYWSASLFAPVKTMLFQILKDKEVETGYGGDIVSGFLGFIYLGLGIAKAAVAQAPTEKEKLVIARGIIVPLRYISQFGMLARKSPPPAIYAAWANIIIVPLIFVVDGALKANESQLNTPLFVAETSLAQVV